MPRPSPLQFLIVIVLLDCAVASSHAQDSLNEMLTPYLSKYELPALAAAVAVDGKIVALGAVGTRSAGEKIPVGVDDRFHLGSDTKAMTALLAAMYVESGKLKWDTTIADVFPDLVEKMDEALGKVTLLQLLSHSSGIPGDNLVFSNLMARATRRPGNLNEQRYWLVKEWSNQPLESDAGAKFAYANMNYIIAGAMIEKVAGKTWEELIVDRVFTPLELRTAGFGPQATLGKIDAPLGHIVVDGKQKPMLSGPNADNPLLLGPAGTAHMAIGDFARWASWNAGRGKRGPKLVPPEVLTKLHTPVISMPAKKDAPPGTPPRGKYALGWGELPVDWAPEPLMFHGGSNTMNLAHVWIDPKRDVALVLATNIGGKKADEALGTLAGVLYKKYAPASAGGQ
jgi:CubicO group peptidase (beta-lactamase class C family)